MCGIALSVGIGAAMSSRAAGPSEADRLVLATAPAALVMIADPGCPHCARFDREVAQGYRASDEGRVAPLVRRLRNATDIGFIEGIVYSPTFVLLVSGREAGRIVGYPGAELFWMQIAGLFANTGLRKPHTAVLQDGASNQRR